MCGICGIYNYKNGETVRPRQIESMCDVMIHRGPDEQGIYIGDGIGLGVRRLSIIDLEHGSQPITNENESIVVILNGEIYNFPELRKSLEAKGHRFRTHADTEVIVHLYEEKGIACLLDFNGMFALAIWDSRTRELFLARDRLGIKPLCYYINNGSVFFASEIKSLLGGAAIERKIDLNAMLDFFSFLYIPAPRTIYKNVKKLQPGCYLRLHGESVTLSQYWSFELDPQNGKTDNEFCQMLADKFDGAVSRQMMSDVPLGAFLSGGIDSSLLVTSMAKVSSEPVKTFTVGFDHNSYDERPYARRIAELVGSEHHDQKILPNMFQDLTSLMWYYDEPFADEAALPTFYLSRAAQESVKVALSGDGADELFAGYRVYQTEQLNRWYATLPKWVRGSILKAVHSAFNLQWSASTLDFLTWLEKGLRLTDMNSERRYLAKYAVFAPEMQHELLRIPAEEVSEGRISTIFGGDDHQNFLEKLLAAGVRFNLPNRMLTKIDRASMATSLEVRVPFLDNEIVDFAARLPLDLKIRGLKTKRIVKKMLSKRISSRALHRPKHGFSVPWKQWFRTDLVSVARDVLDKDVLRRQGILNPKAVRKLLIAHQAGLYNYTRHIYALIVFQLWYNTFMDREVWIAKGR